MTLRRNILNRDGIFYECKFEGLLRKGVEECPFLDIHLDANFEYDKAAGNIPAKEETHETETPLRTITRVTRPVERCGEWVYNTNSTAISDLRLSLHLTLSLCLSRSLCLSLFLSLSLSLSLSVSLSVSPSLSLSVSLSLSFSLSVSLCLSLSLCVSVCLSVSLSEA